MHLGLDPWFCAIVMQVNLPLIRVIRMAFYDEVKTSSGAYKYYVNGQWLESKSGKTQAIMNPSTNQPVYHVQGVPRSIGPRAHVRCSFRQPSVQMQ